MKGFKKIFSNKGRNISQHRLIGIFLGIGTIFSILSCARMGNPDGGWYDEKPPVVISTSPHNGAVNVNPKKVTIYFDEFVTIDNATENVIISPPQLEQAEIKSKGKSIVVELKDSLKENSTYTIDFSDAIHDNNENNPLGNYTFSFSTGDAIDTLEVGGYVLDSETLEPIQGTQVGLYLVGDSVEADTTIIKRFNSEPMLRVSRTDQNGHFIVRGVKPGRYRIYALTDVDNNFMLTPNSGEQMAFLNETIVPSVIDDMRQDTTMLDSLRIKSIQQIKYKHFLPDNIVLRAFTEPRTERAFIKSERTDPEKVSLYFSYGDSLLPEIKGLNCDLKDKYLIEANAKKDSITYWLKDTALVNNDTLDVELTYRATDSLGVLKYQTDTLQLLAKTSYEKRMKAKQKDYGTWSKQQEKRKKRGDPYETVMPPEPYKITVNVNPSLDPDKNITLEFPTPLQTIDTTKVHLYVERDSVWYKAEWMLQEKHNTNIRTLEVLAEWQPGLQYSFETDSAAFVDIYGKASLKQKVGLKVKSLDEYGTFKLNIPTLAGKNIIVQLMQSGDKPAKEIKTNNGVAKFYYLTDGTYYAKIIVDDNNNGLWDTGNFGMLLQPEQVYYYPKEISCRAKWDISETWNPNDKPLNQQKPSKIAKAKTSTKRQVQTNRNLRRARDKGIELPDYLK